MSRSLITRSLPLRSSSHGALGGARPVFSEVPLKEVPSYVRLHVLGNTRRLTKEFVQWYWRTYFHAGKADPIIHGIFLVSGVGYLLHNHCTTPPPKGPLFLPLPLVRPL